MPVFRREKNLRGSNGKKDGFKTNHFLAITKLVVSSINVEDLKSLGNIMPK